MKHILVGLAALFVSLSTQAAMLWWQVDTTDYNTTFPTANQFSIYATSDAGTTKLATTATTGQIVSVDVTNYSSYSFYVELVNWKDASTQTTLAKSDTVAYADLSGHIYTDKLSTPNVTAWHASGYTAVPEPSSAVLLMLGMGLLALKRRK